MNRGEFLARWHVERDAYRAWGLHVSETLERALGDELAPLPIGRFLRVRPTPRLKDDLKLVEKAFFRSKAYDDPYSAITDKVGTRFVVLLGRDVGRIASILEAIPGWTRSKDRDYEVEQSRNPITFDYAAVHYVVRPVAHLEHNGVSVPGGTPCEVQIKTLLQHAYSELTHDTIYKPQIEATTSMRRNAAKAMALLEATNDYFEKVQDEVDDALRRVRTMTSELASIYLDLVGVEARPSALEGMLLEAYSEHAGDFAVELPRLLADRPFLADCIRRRLAETNPVFAQPSVLLAYLEISRSPARAIRRWPLTPAEQRPLLADLGEAGG